MDLKEITAPNFQMVAHLYRFHPFPCGASIDRAIPRETSGNISLFSFCWLEDRYKNYPEIFFSSGSFLAFVSFSVNDLFPLHSQPLGKYERRIITFEVHGCTS